MTNTSEKSTKPDQDTAAVVKPVPKVRKPRQDAKKPTVAAASVVPSLAVVPAGQRVGYVRVSTVEQNTARQLDGVAGLAGVFVDRVSGKDTKRPELARMLAHVRAGDTVTVHSLDRLGRNLFDLLKLVEDMTGRGVTVEFLKEGMTFRPDQANLTNKLMLTMMGAFAEFERELMLERQLEGIIQAKQAGKYKGRAPALPPELRDELAALAQGGVSPADLAERYGVSRATAYRYANPKG